MKTAALVLGAALFASCSSTGDFDPNEPQLFYEQAGRPTSSLNDFEFSDPAAWRTHVEGERSSLELHASSDYQPPFRSPLSIGLITGYWYGDYVLELDAKQTGREYGHRDLCLFFGYQSPSRFYYVHLATTPDQNAHNVFLVDGAARRNLLPPQEKGVEWGEGWHHLRLERMASQGTVRVYFDDMETPVLEAEDDTLAWGGVGVGSFDDTGRFANIEIWTTSALLVQDGEEPFAD